MSHHPSHKAPRSDEPPIKTVAHRPPCVLIAEDDDEIRAMLSAALRRDGYRVVEARNGAELLDHIGSSLLLDASCPRPDVIVSDIRMPGFTGLEVLAGLRDAAFRTPIVLITAHDKETTYEQARKLGANALFYKPFDVDDLRTAVLNMVPKARWLAMRLGPTDRMEGRGH